MEKPLKEYLSDRITSQREEKMKTLRDVIKDEETAFAFGAGISAPAKIPNWNNLVSQMMGYGIQYDAIRGEELTNDEIKRILPICEKFLKGVYKLPSELDNLESAEYIVQFFEAPNIDPYDTLKIRDMAVKSMVSKIIDKAYKPEELLKREKRIKKYLDMDSGDRQIVIGSENEERNYAVIADLLKQGKCVSDAVSGFERQVAKLNTLFAVSYVLAQDTNHINKAITFNYDTLVQEHLLEIYKLTEEKVITHPGIWSDYRRDIGDSHREIYHVHGYVPSTRHVNNANSYAYPDKSGDIILSEDSYYRQESAEAYNWFSSIQSYFLNRYHCLFIGFSAEDFNFRRIIRQLGEMEKNRKKHYLLLAVDDFLKSELQIVTETKELVHLTTEQEKDLMLLNERLLKCREKYWDRFGFETIFATIEEIPELLLNLL